MLELALVKLTFCDILLLRLCGPEDALTTPKFIDLKVPICPGGGDDCFKAPPFV